jgi:hypothetical protein
MRRRSSQYQAEPLALGTSGVGVLFGGGYHRRAARALFARRP